MKNELRFRHELKYRISPAEYLSLRQRLRLVMHPDSHTQEDGRYTIRSIYFDNVDDKALREKINGCAVREKFRIRYYNDDLSFITLEKKMKCNTLCLKDSALISYDQCRKLLRGDLDWMRSHIAQPVRELYCKMHSQQLRPRVLVSYAREPYIYQPGNVRVTFDTDIRTTLYHQTFLEPEVYDICAMDAPDEAILEVKYDAFLPDVIACLLQTDGIRQSAYSKYGICRRFG